MLARRHDALAGGGEGDQEEHRADQCEGGHDLFKAAHPVAIAQDQHQRHQQHLDDELRDHHGHEAVGRQAVALGHAAGQHAAQRGVRQVVRGVNADQQRVGGQCIDHLSALAQVGGAERQQ